MASTGIPREVLKWIQSLDLSYSLRNPKRDISNGFVVAEIIARYWKGVPMHSIDNGTRSSKKIDNWATLNKIFTSKGFHPSKELLDGVITCREGCAIKLLNELYSFLTNRKIQHLPPISAPETTIPAFSKATATTLIRDNTLSGQVDEAIGDLDIRKKEDRAHTVLKQHSESIQKEKVDNPERFKPKPARKMTTMKPPDATTAENAEVNFKEVVVKTIDSAVALRNVRTSYADEKEHSADDVNGFSTTTLEGSIVAALSNIVQKCLTDSQVVDKLNINFPEGTVQNYFTWFTKNLDQIPEDISRMTWSSVMSKSSELGATIFERPHELGKLMTGIANVIHSDNPIEVNTQQAVTLLSVIGDEVTRIDSLVAWQAFLDHIVPRFSSQYHTHTMQEIICHWYCYYDKNEILKMLSTFQYLYTDERGIFNSDQYTSFVLSLVSYQEQGQTVVSCKEAASFIQQHAMSALASPNPLTKAAGIYILGRLGCVVGEVLDLSKSSCCGLDEHWELQSALICYSSDILASSEVSEEAKNLALSVLSNSFTEAAHPLARRVGLSSVGRVISRKTPALGRAYVSVLMKLSNSLFEKELSESGWREVISSKVLQSGHHITPAALDWEPAGIAYYSAEKIAKQGGDEHRLLSVLNAALNSNTEPVEEEEAVETWWAALQAVAPTLKSTTSPELTKLRSGIVMKFYTTLSHEPNMPVEADEISDKATQWLLSVAQ